MEPCSCCCCGSACCSLVDSGLVDAVCLLCIVLLVIVGILEVFCGGSTVVCGCGGLLVLVCTGGGVGR